MGDDDGTDYLARRYGIVSRVKTRTLVGREKEIGDNLTRMISLLDKHIAFWEAASAARTVDALVEAKRVVIDMLDAIHNPAHPIERVCAVIHGRDLSTLVGAIRVPTVDRCDADPTLTRASATDDSVAFKSCLVYVVASIRGLYESLSTDGDHHSDAPRMPI